MNDENTSLKEIVAAYLRNHPEFLDDYPDILEILQIDHRSGVAASLIERQVEQLRLKNEDLSRQLNRLMHVAAENEQLMTRLHHLTLQLLALESCSEFFTSLGNSLLNDFKADILQICLFDKNLADEAGDDVRYIARDAAEMEQFQSNLEESHTVCGRLSQSKLEFLFGSKARWVQSTALVPLGDKGLHGMMAIGSSDPARFYPGMGTLFLDLLSDVIASRLSEGAARDQRRTA